jgi:oligosaccharide repeat unit polymerase
VDLLQSVIFIDIFLLVICGLVLLRHGHISAMHPATPYFVFHIAVITLRMIAVYSGSPTAFSYYGDPVRPEEIAKAGLLGDLSLVMMTLGWLVISRYRGQHPPEDPHHPLNLQAGNLWLFGGVVILLGIIGIGIFSQLYGSGQRYTFNDLENSTWITGLQTWLGLGVVLLVWRYGFKWYLVAIFVAYAVFIMSQGGLRFRIVLPAIMLVYIYLMRRGRLWPQWWLAVILLSAIPVFFSLKSLSGIITGRVEVEYADDLIGANFSNVLVSGGDLAILDFAAAIVTRVDQTNGFYYGRTYLPILTLPVPRFLWPEKPGLAFWVFDVFTPLRPLHQLGVVALLIGDTYMNFSYFGVAFFSFVLAFCSLLCWCKSIGMV